MKKEKNTEGRENFNAIIRKYFRREDVFLVPNVLCYLRVLLIIAFIIVYLVPFSLAGNDKANLFIAAALMVVSVYTDFLDGYIARKFDMQSNLGTILDPIADKLCQLAIAVAIAVKLYQFPFIFILLAVYIVKEAWMFISVILLARKNRSYGGAKWYGKVSTFMLYVIMGVLLVAGPFILEAYPVSVDPFHSHMIIDTLSIVAIFFMVLSLVNYTLLFFKLFHGQGNAEVEKETNQDNGGEKHD